MGELGDGKSCPEQTCRSSSHYTSVQSPLYDSPLQKTSNSFGEIIQMLVRKRIQIMSHIHIEVTSSRCYQINNMQSF